MYMKKRYSYDCFVTCHKVRLLALLTLKPSIYYSHLFLHSSYYSYVTFWNFTFQLLHLLATVFISSCLRVMDQSITDHMSVCYHECELILKIIQFLE